MTRNPPIALWEIPEPDEFGTEIENQRVVEAIPNPGEKGMHFEEDSLLTKLIQLRISVEKSSGNELIEDAHGYRWK